MKNQIGAEKGKFDASQFIAIVYCELCLNSQFIASRRTIYWQHIFQKAIYGHINTKQRHIWLHKYHILGRQILKMEIRAKRQI